MSSGIKNTISVIALFFFLLSLIRSPFATIVNKCGQMIYQLYLIIKDHLAVTEHFGTDASYSRQVLLILFGGHGAKAPENTKNDTLPTKPCGSIKGAFYIFVSLISIPFSMYIFGRFERAPA